MELMPSVVGHDDYEASYYFTVPEDYDENEHDWSQERWVMRCLNREQRGLESYGFMHTPWWIQQSMNLLTNFDIIETERRRDMENSAREARRGAARISR